MDERYKKRGLKFSNALDSRALRAVHIRERQRERRDGMVNTRRQMGDIQNSPQLTDRLKMSDVDKQAGMYQKGLELQQKLLKWKEMKKKQLEREKKKRMPTFKTGIYHPSPPRFLVSEDQQNENGKTPHASLKKTTITPGPVHRKVPVFHLGGTPATSLLKMPRFHTGVTPNMSAKKETSMIKKHRGQENSGSMHRTYGALKNGARARGKRGAAKGCSYRPRKFDEQKDLGVKPLPPTPPVPFCQRKVEKAMLPSQTLPSFAPANFAFDFEVPEISEAKRTEHPSTGGTDDPFPLQQVLEVPLNQSKVRNEDQSVGKEDAPMERKLSFLQENGVGDIAETWGTETQSVHKNDLLPQEGNIGCTSDTGDSEASPLKDANVSGILETSRNEIQSDSVALSDDREDSIHFNTSGPESHLQLPNNEKSSRDQVTSEQKSRCDQVKPEDDRLNLNDVGSSTFERQGKNESGPKRRRTTIPAKNLSRRSVACCYDDTVTPILSRLRPRTPCSRNTRRSLSAHCDTPHELYTPRRKSAKKTPRRSISKAAKRQDPDETHIVSPLPMSLDVGIVAAESLAHDTKDKILDAANESPTHVLQNTPSGITVTAPSPKKSCSPLMTPENIVRREKGMWTVETSPWISSQRSKKTKLMTSDLQGVFDDIPTHESRSEKQKSRKSVMFAITEQDCKLPGTPVRTTSRVSMGLFAKVDPCIEGPIIPDQDLITFDSPMSENKTSRTSRRKSCRVSLLPGMTLSPAKEEAVTIPTDLISLDSPIETNEASGHAAPIRATPVRRSRRLSKIV